MARILPCLLLLIGFPMAQLSWGSSENKESVFQLMDRLAATQGLEAVHGDRFPEINPYGSYGSPYVLDFVDHGDIKRSILFLARRRDESYNKNKSEDAPGRTDHVLNLIREFDYFLVFAIKTSDTESFVVKDILKDGVGLKGMSLYYDYGAINMKSIQFSYLKDGSTIDTSDIDWRKLSIPILISSISSTAILFYYDDKWIEHVEIDW